MGALVPFAQTAFAGAGTPAAHSIERALLSAAVHDLDALYAVTENLTDGDFDDPRHRELFAIVCGLAKRSPRGINPAMLADAVMPNLEACGGAEYVENLIGFSPAVTHMDQYVATLKEKALRRALAAIGTETVRRAYDESTPESAQEIAAWASSVTSDALTVDFGIREPISLKAALESALGAKKDGPVKGVSLGVKAVDGILGDVKPGQTLIVAARPGCGKTAMGIQYAINAAGDGFPVLFLSLEMTKDELADRALSHTSGIDSYIVEKGWFGSHNQGALEYGQNVLNSLPIHIQDERQDIDSILASIRRNHRRHGIKCVVIDYFTLIPPSRTMRDYRLSVADMSKSLQALRKELGIALILLAQFNRQAAAEGRPKLHHLGESSSLEHDANKALLLSFCQEPQPGQKTVEINIDVAKNRNGHTGMVRATYHRHIHTFKDQEGN